MSAADLRELAQRWVDCGMKWRPGMGYVARRRHREFDAWTRGVATESDLGWGDGQPVNPKWVALPDLSHAGTRGFLLEDVREAWGDPTLAAAKCDDNGPRHGCWYVTSAAQRYRPLGGYQPGEVEALIAAREAATE